MGSVYTHRNRLQACASAHGRRRKKNFSLNAEKAAWRWIHATEATLELPALPLLDGPAHVTLGAMLRHYAELYTVGKKSWRGELQRINRYLVPCGLAPLQRVPSVNNAFHLVEARAAAPTHAGGDVALPRTFAVHRAQRAAKRTETNRLRAELARTTVAAIDRAQLRTLVATMTREGLSGSTVRNEMALLKHAFNRAVDEWNWSGFKNPLTRFPLPRPAPAREVTLTRADETRLRAELARADSPYLLPYFELAIETTGRRGSLLDLEWSSVDLEQRELVLHDTKSGENVCVPLTLRAVAVLSRLPRAVGEPRVFPLTAEALDAAWDRACERAGLDGLLKKDCRHVGSTRHAKRLRSTLMLMRVTGHRTLAMAQRYVHFVTDDVLEAFDATESAMPPTPLPPDYTQTSPEALQNARRASHCDGRRRRVGGASDAPASPAAGAPGVSSGDAYRVGAKVVSLAQARRRRRVA